MLNDATACPNCRQKDVTELDNRFQCMECGSWGYSRSSLPYNPEQPENYRPSGQVWRKPRAA